jgi:ribose transport system permease protein
MNQASLQRLLRTAPLLQVGAVIALGIAAAITIDGFLTLTSIYTTLVLAAFLGIAAAGQTTVILIGGIDLSVPALITGANLVSTLLTGKGWSFLPVCLFLLSAATVVGAINGFTTHRFRVPPLIVTLATGAVVTGATLGWTKGGQVSGHVPSWMGTFSSPIGTVLGVRLPPIVLLWALLALALAIVLHLSVSGRRIYATGANEHAAELAGVKTERVWIGAFVFSALSATVVGVLLAGFTGTGQAGIGDSYLFTSLAAVLVGGTSLVGARGDYWRTVLGALILTLITTLLVGHGADESTQEIIIGLLILVFVGMYGRDQRVRDRV